MRVELRIKFHGYLVCGFCCYCISPDGHFDDSKSCNSKRGWNGGSTWRDCGEGAALRVPEPACASKNYWTPVLLVWPSKHCSPGAGGGVKPPILEVAKWQGVMCFGLSGDQKGLGSVWAWWWRCFLSRTIGFVCNVWVARYWEMNVLIQLQKGKANNKFCWSTNKIHCCFLLPKIRQGALAPV